MKIEAAIFDIGNVLLLFDYMVAADRLASKNSLTTLPDRERIVSAKQAYETGGISRAAFLELVRPEFRDTGEEEDFVRIWEDIFVENLPMTSLARQLAAEMPVFLISNISCIHWDYISKHYDIFSIFRGHVLSYQVKLLKPDPQIFELAVEKFNIDPSRTLYFDDLLENVESASSVGLLGFHYSHTRHADVETFLSRSSP